MQQASSFGYVKTATFFGLLLGASAGFLYLISDYLMPIIWAVVLAIVFSPLCYHLTRMMHGMRTLATIATMLIALITVFTPISVVGGIVAKESISVYQTLSTQDLTLSMEHLWALPPVAFALDRLQTTPAELQVSFAETIRSTGSAIAQGALGVGAEVLNVLAKILVMLYLLFFFLRDGEKIASRLMRMFPLGDTRELFLFERFSTTVRAVMKGTLIVALVQGGIGGILFAVAGVKSAALWGAAIALFAIIPAAGPAVVWIPAALILFYMGDTFGALVIALGGSVVISTIDNILRPILVGKDTNMPDSLILLSVLGGIATFGIAGVVLGPVVAALFLALWHLFEEQYHDELIARG